MKRYKVILSLVLVLVLMITGTAFGAVKEGITYTALGDSIAYGTGAEDDYGYTEMLNDHFTRIYGEGIFNKDAADGITSGDLVNWLPVVQQHVVDADVITISIGGNDLLKPFQDLLSQFLMANYEYLNYSKFMEDFTAWQNGDLGDLILKAKFDKLFYFDLPTAFTTGAYNFSLNFPTIMDSIGMMNLDAEIYVNTIYNPFTTDPMLHDFAELFIPAMNEMIIDYSQVYDYKVVDVYTKFEK